MGAPRPLLSRAKGGAVLFPLVLLAACSGPSGSMRKAVNAQLAAGDYAGAEARVQQEKVPSYGAKNAVLFYLDLGAVQHDGGKYKESDQSFAVAEARMEELYTKSVSKAAGTLLLNDNTVDYAGERFERALVNVYRALDYLWLGNRDDALVEVRKLVRLLQEYVDRYGGARTVYKDDAFGQYLSALLYADDGKDDDARISLDAAKRAYRLYASAYGTPTPPLDAALPRGGAGELVFLHLNGVAPRKVSRSFQVAWHEAVAAVNATKNDEAQGGQAANAVRAGMLGQAITVSYPAYEQDPYQVAGSEVEVDGKTAETALVEDVSAIAQKDLAERQALIKTRAVARAAIKFILSKAATDAAEKKYGKNSFEALAAKIGTAALSAATEVADTRAWATLPAQFRLARLVLPPGDHKVVVRYRNAAGAVLLTREYSVTIRKGQRAYLHDRTAL
ncbi:MAG: hypothetical protein HY079_02020 [Elusimicrobia bacterium]|nr:hypothetical protein [Elusimicrobiota bacterium]